MTKTNDDTAQKTQVTPLDDSPDWTFDLLGQYQQEIARVADFYRLDTYTNQIEVITAEQMMDAYASVGMPIGYSHWTFGKKFIQTEQNYQRGQMGLAYEIVINSSPCISYLMEENTMTMQALVMAHACYGHNSFFKGNYLFKSWTDASSIIDYLLFAKNYIFHIMKQFQQNLNFHLLHYLHLQTYNHYIENLNFVKTKCVSESSVTLHMETYKTNWVRPLLDHC